MKKFGILLLILMFSGCAWVNTGPKNPFTYPSMPTALEPGYTSPRAAEDRDVCIIPEMAIKQMKHEIEWQTVYEKMKGVIDSVNQTR